MEKRTPIAVDLAVERVIQCRVTGETEYIDIQLANGRILAEDLIADHDVPAFNRSPYDGYAVRAKDTLGASVNTVITLNIVGHIGAGSVFDKEIKRMEAVRIMTGAEIPKGADAVIMLEDTNTNDDNTVQISQEMNFHQNISFQGEDVEKGSVLVSKGTKINPGIIALLATFGYQKVPVSKRPVFGVIATGSELLEIHQPLEKGKIRNSNAYMIIAQIERAGGKAKYFGQLSDDLDKSIKKIGEILNEVDFLITTGGVSVGDFDLLPEIYHHFGAEVLFNKVAMRPGSVTTVAQLDGKLLFGLSGNPSACYVGFELFAKPIIDSYLQKQMIGLKRAHAVLAVDFPKSNPFDRFIRGHVNNVNHQLEVKPSGKDKSNMVHSLANVNCFIHLLGGTEGYKKGSIVDILLLD